jgi:hypothetical protein
MEFTMNMPIATSPRAPISRCAAAVLEESPEDIAGYSLADLDRTVRRHGAMILVGPMTRFQYEPARSGDRQPIRGGVCHGAL